jgi:PleD family two-component response regulator
MTVEPLPAVARGQAKARILVVDDDERNLLALSQVLEDIAEVVTAASGKDALRQLLGQDFAVSATIGRSAKRGSLRISRVVS